MPRDPSRHSLKEALSMGARLHAYMDQRPPRQRALVSSLSAAQGALGLPGGPSTLWRAYAIYRLSLSHPELSRCKHLGVAHLSVILGAPRHEQPTLMQRAEAGNWTRVRLLREVARLRNPTKAEQ